MTSFGHLALPQQSTEHSYIDNFTDNCARSDEPLVFSGVVEG